MTKRMTIGLASILMMGVGLLFAASTAPPGYHAGAQAQQSHQTYMTDTHDTSGGLKAHAAPEVQPGATNAGANLLHRALILFSVLGLFSGVAVVLGHGRNHQPGREVLAGVGEACAV